LPEEKGITSDFMQTLTEILMWTRFENFPKLRKILLDTLTTDEEKRAYELTDGERSRRDIARKIGVSNSTIQSWWNKWYNLGILEPSGKRKGRPQKIVALEDMGIEAPKGFAKKPKFKEKVSKEETEQNQENVGLKSGDRSA
jgi:transposase-like protein